MAVSKSRSMTVPNIKDSGVNAPLAAAQAVHGKQKVVGFISNNVPIELIHAAGCFPLQLPTAPEPSTPLADQYMEQGFDPLARSAFERLLRGDFDCIDLLVLPRSVDSLQRLYYYICELRRSFGVRLPDVYLYDLLHTPYYTSAEYNYARTGELRTRLEALSGRTIEDATLRDSIALYNQLRRKLSALFDRRRALPCQLTGTRMLACLHASQRIAPEDLLRMLDAQLAQPPQSAAGIRTLLVGSAHDSTTLHELVAHAGGQIVGDYHWWGEPLFGPELDEHTPAMRAISSHYHRDSLSVRSFPASTGPVCTFARAVSAQAAIFYYYAEEEALTWDAPAQIAALRELGIVCLHLAAQPYPPPMTLLPELTEFFASTKVGHV
jgi:benzoyl-CoA reductase/2-hydroxyglutaryl-CoA dehydratase subunit BcrC/BadD/HgdB